MKLTPDNLTNEAREIARAKETLRDAGFEFGEWGRDNNSGRNNARAAIEVRRAISRAVVEISRAEMALVDFRFADESGGEQ